MSHDPGLTVDLWAQGEIAAGVSINAT